VLTHDDVVRLYGPWCHRTPHDAARLLDGNPGRWWVAGGWAVEAFTGAPRDHGDVDVTRGSEWVYERDGVRYLRPEVQLLHKAPGRRAVDQRDFEVAAPLLDDAASSWLRSALELAHPGHPWLAQL
jgi:hypothetical protein